MTTAIRFTDRKFNIQDWLEFRNGRASCPCCEVEKGKPNGNLSLVPGSNGAYKCHAGHTPAEIRAILGAPTPQRLSGISDFLPHLNTTKQLVSDKLKKEYTVNESYVCGSVERLLRPDGEPQRQALIWLEGRGFTRQTIEHYQLGLEQISFKSAQNALEKEIYWAIAIFIPVPGQPGRYYKKMRVAPRLTGDARPEHLSRWSQFGVPATIWFTHKPEDATQTWFVEGEWDAMRLGFLARQRGEKVTIACSTGGCGTVPAKEQLEQLPGNVVVFYDRNDPLNPHTGSRPGDEGAQKLARALGARGRVGLVPMPENCEVPGWDVSNALDEGFSWEDFEHSAAAATVAASNVTGDNIIGSDSHSQLQMDISATVTAVTALLEWGLPDWEEQAHLDALQSQSVISKTSFWQLVASIRCQSDEVMLSDEQQLSQLIEWKNASLDFTTVLPHLANDLLHDGRVLNIDPVMIWQYLLPATLSLVGKKVDLDVGSHKVPAIAWTCSVGESGTGKSRAEGLVLKQLKAWQEAEHNRFKLEWAEHKQLQTKKSEENSESVVPPVPERKFLFETATIQAVMKRLSEQGENGSLWARDEIAGLFKSLGQFASKGEGEGLECLLPMWDGSSAAVDRVLHEDSYYLASSRLGIAGGIQPGVFRKIFTDPDDAQGLQARFLFALPKVQSAKRVKGYCQLADKLPQFYSWVATEFPAGTIKLSLAADARYDAVYENIGQQAEQAETPAIRAWMRKLPGQLLRIALALHIIECYHEKERSRHELQLDTLNRAVDFCRYYRSAFAITQQTATDSDSISSILIKIWDMAATTPSGLAVRDAYRGVKALQRRAKELGRNVGAYTLDLYYQLEKMGKGVVQRQGRLVKFITGINSLLSTPLSDGTDAVTKGTDTETQIEQGLQVAHLSKVSPVTEQDVRRVDTVTNDIEQDLSTYIASKTSENSPPTSDEPDDAPPFRNGVLPEPEPDDSLRSGETELLSPIGVCAQVNSSIIPKQSAGVTETLQNHQFTNSHAVTSFQPEFQTRGGITNPAATQLQQLTTAQNLAAQILLCQTWVELAEVVGQSTSKLLVAANQMTKQQRHGLKNLLAAHLCSNPAELGQLAWVPEQLLERALACLSFTIRRIGGAANVLDACLESIPGCKLVSVKHLGTCREAWIFQSPEGKRLPVFGVDAVLAITCDSKLLDS